MDGKLDAVADHSGQRRAGHTDSQDQQVVKADVYEGGGDGGKGDHLNLLVVVFVVNGEGAQEIQVVAGDKQGDQPGGAPEILSGKQMVHLRAQQDKPGGEHGVNLQEIPGLVHHRVLAAMLGVLKVEGNPGVVQGTENGKQDGAELESHGVDAADSIPGELPQHDHIAVAQQKVRQVVEHIGNGQGNAEPPVFGAEEGSALEEDIAAQAQPQNAIDRRNGDDPPIVVDFPGQGQHKYQGKGQGAQRREYGEHHVPSGLQLVGQLGVHKVDAVGADGLEQNQGDEKPGEMQPLADGVQEEGHHQADHKKNQKRQAHHTGLVFDLLLLRIFHPGVYQGALGLQGGGNGQHADPYIVVCQISIAPGAQQPGKEGGGENGNAIEQAGAEDVKEGNAVSLFHCLFLSVRQCSRQTGPKSPRTSSRYCSFCFLEIRELPRKKGTCLPRSLRHRR